MIATARYLIISAILLALCHPGMAQTSFAVRLDTIRSTQNCNPPINREIFHDYIDNEQKSLLKSDGKNDNLFTPSTNDEINFLVSQSLINRIDNLQCRIEADSTLNHSGKVRYLRGMENLLKFFAGNTRTRKVKAVFLPEIVSAYEAFIQNDKAGKSIEGLIQNLPYEVAYSVLRADRTTFEKNPGYKNSLNTVILKYCLYRPELTFQTLKENPDVPFADSMIRVVARKYPRQLYDYAAASNKLSNIIRNIQDDIFIRSVARMARSRSGQQYFPFLDNIVNGRMRFEDIDAVMDDSIQYYKLLVKTQIDYVDRAINKDTAMEFKSLTAKLTSRARDVFVTTINGLHNENDNVRFRCIQPLSAQELYYLAVLTDGLIYTSSYTKGVYPLMMKKANNRGDSLLMSLRFDHYRKFISQAAAYNTLGGFLASFPNSGDADDLMKAFVSKLERSEGLEDGVDVADSYASIVETLKPRAVEMMKNVRMNYDRNLAENNRRGIVIYNILNKLFLSADSTNKIDLTKELGIPPVYNVPYSSLASEKGEVVAQVFFYGDKDGMNIFSGFQNMFSSANWKIDRSNPQWITISSIKGKPVIIYANRPLPEEKGEDDLAQRTLGEYLEKNNIRPTVTIHRGHSYFTNSTIAYMAPSSRIVFMGSCGGFNLINDILAKTNDAHIIASKQIGKTAINRPFFALLTEKLRTGSNIDWIPFWKEFESATSAEGFEDYIPPYKNLGAIFIKAYKKAMGEDLVSE
ncbi:MAG TPA: hypothetical protein VFX58_17065 [Chitinophagaceae bacterium]|nr:hypothetical protein [Chitinophagaceae bacterium]